VKKQSTSRSGFFNPRILVSLFFCAIGAFLMLLGFDGVAQGAGAKNKNAVRFQSVASYHNDRSAPARDLALLPARKFEHEDNENPKIPFHHKDAPDRVVQGKKVGTAQLGPVAPAMPNTASRLVTAFVRQHHHDS
jgi:hypothetical protein